VHISSVCLSPSINFFTFSLSKEGLIAAIQKFSGKLKVYTDVLYTDYFLLGMFGRLATDIALLVLTLETLTAIALRVGTDDGDDDTEYGRSIYTG